MKFLLAIIISFSLYANQFEDIFIEAGKYYDINPKLLKAIAKIESNFNPNAIRVNKNGTKDYGMMQINSIHLRELSFHGIDEKQLMEPKINIFVGAALLDRHLKIFGKDMESIGRYHSATPQYKYQWLQKLIKAYSNDG